MDFSRRDLGALNIMRGRDNGLPDYNTVRMFFNLSRLESWNEVNPDLTVDMIKKLEGLYNGLDNVDVYVGGMLESNGNVGELFKTIMIEQFTRIRDADRFWFENEFNG